MGPAGLPSRLALLDRPVVMGIVNTTPDSFSDGGRYLAAEAAIARGRELARRGADIVDVGGESTRPGAQPVPIAEEQARVLPVIEALAGDGIAVSVDTMHATTACAAVAAGACLVNDVSGGLADPDMLRSIADLAVPCVLMHWRGPSTVMDAMSRYDDVVVEVRDALRQRVDAAVAAGVPAERIVIDPGLGFAKNADHNWALLNRLGALVELGLPVLVGASRKRFLGALLAEEADGTRPVDGRDAATDAVSALAAASGAWGVRVHDVANSRDAVLVGRAWRLGRATGPGMRGRT